MNLITFCNYNILSPLLTYAPHQSHKAHSFFSQVDCIFNIPLQDTPSAFYLKNLPFSKKVFFIENLAGIRYNPKSRKKNKLFDN